MSTAERDARIARIIADIKSICEVLEPGSITSLRGGDATQDRSVFPQGPDADRTTAAAGSVQSGAGSSSPAPITKGIICAGI